MSKLNSGMKKSIIFILCLFSSVAIAQNFERIDINFSGLSNGRATLVDINSNGKLDVFFTGLDNFNIPKTLIYLNNGDETFTLFNSNIPDFAAASVAWGDYNGNGKLDLLIAGLTSEGLRTMIYQNNMPLGFIPINAGLVTVHSGTVDWVDVNNNGRPDIFITGLDSFGVSVSKLYLNNPMGFQEVTVNIPGLYNSSTSWYDFDKDNDLDLLISGQVTENPNSFITKIYRNDNGELVDSGIELPQLSNSSLMWGDFDADGYADILIIGQLLSSANYITKVYRNNQQGGFVEYSSTIPGIAHGSARWGDFNNNGYLDILLTGNRPGNNVGFTNIYRNVNGNFVLVQSNLPDLLYSAAFPGDFNNNFKLDFLAIGHDPFVNIKTAAIFKNLTPNANEVPVEPKGLTTTFDNIGVHFNWEPAFDFETPSPGLTYNLRVGTTPGGSEILAPNSSGEDGFYKLPGPGNVGNNTGWSLKDLDTGRYYWSVQTVDNSFHTSEYAAERTFVKLESTIIIGQQSEIIPDKIILRQNYPNPFNPETVIEYELPKATNVKLVIHNSLGKEIEVLLNSFQNAGTYKVVWNVLNNRFDLASGIYWFSLITPDKVVTRSMVLLK